jgi:hypothetical protein
MSRIAVVSVPARVEKNSKVTRTSRVEALRYDNKQKVESLHINDWRLRLEATRNIALLWVPRVTRAVLNSIYLSVLRRFLKINEKANHPRLTFMNIALLV